MRSLVDIERDLEAARKALATVEGNPAEVYSRIVGYYRSVRNWNRGKREEYGERLLYNADTAVEAPVSTQAATPVSVACTPAPVAREAQDANLDSRVLLFVRPACPACPSAKVAAGRLGIPVDMVNADTEAGLAEAKKRHVLSTPTAILLAKDGQELGRARDNASIAAFGELVS
jgi:ribonucleoside-triphosphate reductase